MIARTRPLVAFAAAFAVFGTANAQETDGVLTGSLKSIADRGTIAIGHRTSSIPFSFLNQAGQPIGFAVDICRGIAAQVARRLQRDLIEPDAPAWQKGVRIVFVPLTAEERVSKVVSGGADLECGPTTATDERRKTVAFSPVFFLAGTKLMVKAGSGLSSYRDLAGRKLAVSSGTTNAEAMRRLAGQLSPRMEVEEFASVDAAVDALASGNTDGAASDDVLLYGLKASRPDARALAIIGDYLTFEPYAIMFRKDDREFAALVRQSFEQMAADNVLSASYARWFTKPLPTGTSLGIPMSPYLAEIYRGLGQSD